MRSKFLIFNLFLTVIISAQQELSWEFFNPKSNSWKNFGKTGSIQEKYIESGELPDPFFGTNEVEFKWIEERKWELKTQFYLSEEEFKATSLQLFFPNIDTYAEVYLNEKKVYSAANFFHPHSIEIKDLSVCGFNYVRLVFTPPILYHEKQYNSESFHYPAPNDLNPIKAAPLTRKPQYQFGWDWALRMNTIGFSKPASIIIGKENKILNCVVSTKEITENYAWLNYHINLDKNDSEFFLISDLLGVISAEDVSSNKDGFQVDLKMDSPRLWWPKGLGEHYIYEDTLRLYNKNKQLLDEKIIQFGIRKAELVQQKDQWGTSYEFRINDIPVFCRGADYIPQSVFPASVKDEDIVNMIEQLDLSNFNIVRVWGGGYYPDDIFFKTCDEKGIMVWQDLMFACAMYPGDSSFLNSVERELNYQIPRITQHPSVVLINGNNEVDVAWKNWGFQSQYNLNESANKVIEKAYVDLFQKLAPKVVSIFSKTAYIHTSPLSNWGNSEFYNHGSQHYWGVWHGKDPMSDFANKIGRFNAEYGFQSFPEFSTLSAFCDKKDWSLQSKVMKHHQKSYVGNEMIKKHADNMFGEANSFEQFVYFSQLTQAYAVSSAVSGHRLDAPRCMGTLYWQLNDCWPAPTWSSIDFSGNWKALHYAIREDYRDLAVLKTIDKSNEAHIWLKSDVNQIQNVKVQLDVYSLDGKLEDRKDIFQEIKYQEKVEIWNQKTTKFNHDVLIRVNLNGTYERTFLISNKKKFSKGYVSLKLINVDEKNKKAEIQVQNSKFCSDFWLYSMKTGVHFNKNFEHLLPGKHIFKITFNEVPKEGDFYFINR